MQCRHSESTASAPQDDRKGALRKQARRSIIRRKCPKDRVRWYVRLVSTITTVSSSAVYLKRDTPGMQKHDTAPAN